MSLLDDLRNLLARHLAHVGTQTQQGTVALIEDHLNRLDAVVSGDLAAAEAKVHEILGELYGTKNAPAPAVPSEPATASEATPEPAPAPANPTSMAPAAAPVPEPAPAAEEAPAPVEAVEPAAPETDTTPAA